MTTFTVTIDDQAMLDGITYARETRNNGLPRDTDGNPIGEIATDEDYIAYVITTAAASYARQKESAEISEGVVAAKGGDRTKLEAVAAALVAARKP